MTANLTTGAISMLSSGAWKAMDLKPVLQVTDIRIVQTRTSAGEMKKRFMLLLSDGSYHLHGILAHHLTDLVTSHHLHMCSIVQLTQFDCITVHEQFCSIIIVAVDLNLIMDRCDIIGDPKPFPNKHNETSSVETKSSMNQPGITVTRSNTNATDRMLPSIRPRKRPAPGIAVEGGNDDDCRPITRREYKKLRSEITKSNKKLDEILSLLKKA